MGRSKTKHQISRADKLAFLSYFRSFYFPGGLYAHFFTPRVTVAEFEAALKVRLTMPTPFDGDSFDRELVRDIIFRMRGQTETEHKILL
jgi:hypothetical protein